MFSSFFKVFGFDKSVARFIRDLFRYRGVLLVSSVAR